MLATTTAEIMPGLGGQSGTIGGSNVAAIMGLSPWSGPFDVWEAATIGRERVTSPAMVRGIRLEPITAALAEEALGFTCVEPNVRTITKSDDPRFTASIDLEAWTKEGELAGLIELKTAGLRANWRKGVPSYYWPQLQHYLWVKNVDRGWFVCLQASDEVFNLIDTVEDARRAIDLGSARLHVHAARRDPEYAEEVVPVLERFYDMYIATGTPPPADYTAGCTRVLRKLYPERTGYARITDDLLEAARARLWWATVEKEAKEKKQEAENKIRQGLKGKLAAVDEAAFIQLEAAQTDKERKAAMKAIQVRVEVSARAGRKSLDQTALKQEYPEIYEQFSRQGASYDAIKIKGVE